MMNRISEYFRIKYVKYVEAHVYLVVKFKV
jgi:hypothetical protein